MIGQILDEPYWTDLRNLVDAIKLSGGDKFKLPSVNAGPVVFYELVVRSLMISSAEGSNEGLTRDELFDIINLNLPQFKNHMLTEVWVGDVLKEKISPDFSKENDLKVIFDYLEKTSRRD